MLPAAALTLNRPSAPVVAVAVVPPEVSTVTVTPARAAWVSAATTLPVMLTCVTLGSLLDFSVGEKMPVAPAVNVALAFAVA